MGGNERMKIVISISKENYEYIKKHANEEVLPVGWREIIKGLPLPENVKISTGQEQR
jgi:hypothetical protein